MSRYGHGYKTELDGLLWIDTATLKKLGYLRDGTISGNLFWTNNMSGGQSSVHITVYVTGPVGKINLNYTTTDNFSDEKVHHDYPVYINATRCNYGGHRYWFICPLTKGSVMCKQRVRKLYCRSGYFGCRSCLELTYSSQNESPTYRAGLYGMLGDESKAEKLSEQIRVPYYKGKPTRKMRRYLQLQNRLEALENSPEILKKLMETLEMEL